MPPWLELSESPSVLEIDPEPNQPKVGWQRRAVKQGGAGIHSKRGVADVG